MVSASLSRVSTTPLQSDKDVAEDNKENETPGNQVQQRTDKSSLKTTRRRVLQDVQPSEVTEFRLKGSSFLDKLQPKEDDHGVSEIERMDVGSSLESNDVAIPDLRRDRVQVSSHKHMNDGWDSILEDVVVQERKTFLHFSIPTITTPRKFTSPLSGSTDPKDFKPQEFNFKECDVE